MLSKTVIIHQPDFMPYLGFFQRLIDADLYVILDNVQFLSGSKSWHNRDKIKIRDGSDAWLTVPIQKMPQKTPINLIMIAEDREWRNRHLNLLEHNYRTALFFEEIWPMVESLYAGTETMLADFSLASIRMLMELFNIRIKMVKASELETAGTRNELLVDILKKTGATSYLSGIGAREYFDPVPFCQAGVQVNWQQFKHPVYNQLHGPFIPFLSSIDLLFNCGQDSARSIVRSC